jgi:hypothetical protein
MQKILFQKKISYLFEEFKKAEICDEKGLVELFSENGIYSNTRKKTVIDKWLNGNMKQPPKNILFSFNQYPISYEYKLPNGKNAFSKESFLSSSFSFDSFKQEVDEYIAYKNRPISLLEYNYIYYYYRKKKKIVYAKLETEEKINQNKYVIKIIPPLSSTGKKIPPYKGILEINNERYYISVKNDVEILTLYFVLGRGYADNSKVYGIGLGISHKKGLVEATKELLSKRKLTKEEEDELYLSLNESEYLIADEIEYTDSIKKEYLKKINTKLNNLTTFISTSKESLTLQNKVNTDPYLNIFFRNLIDTNEISKKIILEQYFFTVRRRTALKAFLKSISNIEKNTSKMVYPVFEEDSVLFDKEDEVSVKLLNTISSLAKNGLDLTIIFVVDEKFTIKPNFQKETKKLIDNGVKIKIVFLEDIQKLRLSSHDFLYSKKDELVAIYTSVRDRIRIYKVTTMRGRIKYLIDDFKKIEQKSFLFDDFVEKKKLTHDLVLGQLVGTWNFYSYGSVKNLDNEFKLWHDKVNIFPDTKVTYTFANQEYFMGYINTEYNKHQAFIYLTSLDSHTLSLISINKENIYKNIFKVSMIDKQVGTNYDMATFGIFSKIELDKDVIKDLLGNIDDVMLRENMALEQRINKFYHQSKF